MSAPNFPDFAKWSPIELKKAEVAATEFLTRNSVSIADTFEKRLSLLHLVTAKLKAPELTFGERMLCLSLVDDLSRGLSESARDFFEIGCAPSVANMVLR